MDGNFEQNQNWQDPNQNQQNQNWQNPNQNWQDPNLNQQNPNWQNTNQNSYYNGYNNGQQNNGYPNSNGYPNPNMPNQGYVGNNGYNQYANNGYNGPIVVANAAPVKGNGGLAIGSLVCGIISILGFWSVITLIVAIVGVVLGAVNNAQDSQNKGMAIAGIILSIIGFLLSLFFIVILMEI